MVTYSVTCADESCRTETKNYDGNVHGWTVLPSTSGHARDQSHPGENEMYEGTGAEAEGLL